MTAREDFDEGSRLLKSLGHPLRLKIVCGLMGEPASLSHIARAMEVPISTLAQHLAVLRRCGILAEERSGVEIRFRVMEPRVAAILAALCGGESKAKRPARWKWRELSAATTLARSPR